MEEEQQLKEYFNQEDVDPQLQRYKPLFEYLKVEQTVEISLSEEQLKPKGHIIGFWSWKRWTAVAASVAILALASFWLYPKGGDIEMPSYAKEDTYSDPNQAYDEVKAALLLVSNKLNKGVETTKNELRDLRK